MNNCLNRVLGFLGIETPKKNVEINSNNGKLSLFIRLSDDDIKEIASEKHKQWWRDLPFEEKQKYYDRIAIKPSDIQNDLPIGSEAFMESVFFAKLLIMSERITLEFI
jgi:hypothetical protein